MSDRNTTQTITIHPPDSSFADSFGAALLSARVLDGQAIDRAQRAAATTGERFDHVLAKLGMLSEADLAAQLARFLGLVHYIPGERTHGRLLDDALPAPFLLQNRILPIEIEDETLRLAVVDPFDPLPIESIRHVTGKRIVPEIIAGADFDRIANALYAGGQGAQAAPAPREASDESSEYDLQRLRDSASGAPVIRLVNQIIALAVDASASDIHIESRQDALIVRYRVDGVLRVVDTIPLRLRAAVVSRFKILAKLDIAERRLPQDGRIKLAFRGSEIDFRVATIPTAYGESIVVRVLDKARVDLNFSTLGFRDQHIQLLHQLMTHANGIIFVTGPTGSGKTTTLYTMLKRVNQPGVKILTVEDPIEYQLDGINQVQVQPSIGLDFPACLRSILRQDPDLIMIGEVRDAETARIAVQASLTGHLVFCTLHTNDAPATITRLMDMGIEQFLIGSTVKGIVAQRLVRRICPHCARPHSKLSYWVKSLSARAPSLCEHGEPSIFEAVGCNACKMTGFRGRLTIAEILMVDDNVQDAILKRKSVVELAAAGRSAGMISMQEDGLIKAWNGQTTIEEVLRITDVAGAATL